MLSWIRRTPLAERAAARRPGRGAAALVALLAPAAPLVAQLVPSAPEFQVNTYTTSDQVAVRGTVAADAQGGFLVVWTSDGSDGGDTDAFSVQLQRFGSTGVPLGGEFQVNVYTTGSQTLPAVARRPSGEFVVVWASDGSSGGDTASYSIQAQRFGAGGARLGGQFQVNTYTTGPQLLPAVAIDALGNFVVAWSSFGSSGGDTSSWSVHAQRYAANGAALGGEFQVNTYTTSEQNFASVARAATGEFVVVWASDGSSGGDTDLRSIHGQRFDANGTPVSGEFQVNSYSTGDQARPAVAVDALGNFLVAWSSEGSDGTDIDLTSIQAQAYDASGAALGGQFQVNTTTTSYQSVPAVAFGEDGGAAILWQSASSGGTDTDGFSIQAQRFDQDLAPVGAEFQLNTYTTGYQVSPSLAGLPAGEFVVSWTSVGSAGGDTDGYSVQARAFCSLFCNGFESGDTSGWSASSP